MSIDILNMRHFNSSENSIDIALPVLAIECEATPPMQNYLDSYEEAVLKLVSLGYTVHVISKTLNATESLIEDILSQLESKEYVNREIGRKWKLTEEGQRYLDGTIQERASSNSQYGFMFINAIKKEVLPFFYPGDIGMISLFRGSAYKLNSGNEEKTFVSSDIKQQRLKKAYKSFFRYTETISEYENGDITKEEAEDRFADLESFDEEIDSDEPINEIETNRLKRNMFIRPLKNAPRKVYLHMQIIIDPSKVGGYSVESPFDFQGVDNSYFLRQIQWLEQSDETTLEGEIFQKVLSREICKLSPSFKYSDKNFQVFVLERIPLLKMFRSRFSYLYEDMERIYSLMQRQNSLIEKENIVNNLARSVVERLFNEYFKNITTANLSQIRQRANDDIDIYGHIEYKKRILQNVNMSEDKYRWVRQEYLRTMVKRLDFTYGNSIKEKLFNMMVIEYHLGNLYIRRFLSQTDADSTYDIIDNLNQIRRKVSHDTDDRFTNEDYNYYMANVFVLINNLLEPFRED